MRDIRSDLQERLDAVTRDREDLRQRLAELEAVEASINALLLRESAQFSARTNGNGNGTPVAGLNLSASDAAFYEGGTDLARLLLQTLRRSGKAMPLEDLKDAAERAGLDFGAKAPGRVIHWALVGMAQSGSVEKIGEMWQIKPEAQSGQQKGVTEVTP